MPKRVWRAVRRSFTAPATRYPPDPRALFLLVMCVMSGVPLMFANATPQSIVDQLQKSPHGGKAWVVIWGVMLTGGAALTLWGALRQTVNGVVAEQVGSLALGFACLIFAVAIYGYIGWAGAVTMFLVFGFGVASIFRWGQLVAYLKALETLTQAIRDETTGDEQ